MQIEEIQAKLEAGGLSLFERAELQDQLRELQPKETPTEEPTVCNLDDEGCLMCGS